jgi:hypothetical protein
MRRALAKRAILENRSFWSIYLSLPHLYRQESGPWFGLPFQWSAFRNVVRMICTRTGL